MTAERLAGVDPGIRWLGAVAGAFLGVVAAAAVYVALLTPPLAGLGLVESLLGPDGLFTLIGGWSLLVWGTGPVSAALAGGWLAPRAIAGDRWSGIGMGFGTYGIGVVIGPLLVLGPATVMAGPGPMPVSPMELASTWVTSGMVLTAVGAVLLYPLLIVAALFGMGWARLTRSLAEASHLGIAAGPPRPLPVGALIAVAAPLGLLWLGLAAVLLGSGPGDAWLD
jgi:hypothetical protein